VVDHVLHVKLVVIALGTALAVPVLVVASMVLVVTATVTPGRTAVAWAESQRGAPYAAIDPYRFGEPAWPGGTLTGFRGDVYDFDPGTVVYDCSGFVVAAWRHAGVDLVSSAHVASSQDLPASALPDVTRDALQAGDLIAYGLTNGVGHIVMVDHVDPDGTVVTIEARPHGGVQFGSVDWPKVIAMKHPVVPAGSPAGT
jgi:NlpC/P60 family